MITKPRKNALQFKDTITQLSFDPEHLIGSSWDGTIVLLLLNTFQTSIITVPESLPQLDCISLKKDNDKIASVDIDNKMNIFSKGKASIISSIPVETPKSLFKLACTDSCLIAADRNKSLYIYDDKGNKQSEYKTERQMSQMKMIDNKSLVCPDKDFITFYDLRKMSKPYMTIPNMMKTEIASIGYIPKEAMLYGSIEGKIAVEYFDTSKAQNYSFKCHRIETEKDIKVYSVNAIEYDQSRDVFYSGGSDGYLYSWDNKKRKKIFKSERYSEPISHLAINNAANSLAVGCSWLYEDGDFSSNSEHKHYIDIISLTELKANK